MNRKYLTVLIILCAVFALTGCSRAFTDPNVREAFDAKKILENEIPGIRGRGFAADLCVSSIPGEENAENVNAEAFALFDVDGKQIISQKNIYEKVYPASTTKILTCLLALELCDPEEYVTVPKEAEIDISGSSMAGLRAGDRLKMKDLLYALMVPSGNDAAVAVAVHISDSVEEFSRLMNKRAAGLGATGSHFCNPHGLPEEEHYTTVYDMYLIFHEAMKNRDFREIASTKEKTVKVTNSLDLTERSVTWTSGNGFCNGKYTLPGGFRLTGGKTGHTNAAGFCLVLGETAKSGNECIAIIMKAPAYEELYEGMIRLTSKMPL